MLMAYDHSTVYFLKDIFYGILYKRIRNSHPHYWQGHPLVYTKIYFSICLSIRRLSVWWMISTWDRTQKQLQNLLIIIYDIEISLPLFELIHELLTNF